MILTSVITLCLLGILASALLGVAARVFYVEEDPRVEALTEALPGSNCGGCGFAGCASYAEAVLKDPAVAANLCVAGGNKTAQTVGDLSGKAAGTCEPRMSFRRCAKTEGAMRHVFAYAGLSSCVAAAATADGPDQCAYSCLGLGDCLRACPFDAIVIKNGMATIVVERCVGCAKCIAACPREVLELTPLDHRVMIFCSTQNKGKAAMDSCSVGCINCMACVRKCPAKAVSSRDGRIRIDHRACMAFGSGCEDACLAACPRKILRSTCPPELKAQAAPAQSVQAAVPA
jgi:electron transport complex protein RnfB